MKMIGIKWVFKLKLNLNMFVQQHKVRLVAKGFYQTLWVDFSKPFSLMIKLSSIHIVLSLIVTRGWDIQQLDVNNVFFHEWLNEFVFMQQVEGFVDVTKPIYVC